ncbi:MAG: class I SAM-dependent methyltransferase, partial [Terriglobia bacterium]
VREANLPAESFDAVVMWDVIEHLHDPAGTIRALSELVKPGGVFCLSTMDVGALFAKLTGRHWPWFMRMHLYYFTPGTVTRMLQDAGLDVLAIERHKRIVSLRYFLGKIAASIAPSLGKAGDWIGKPFGKVYVTIDLGDIMNIFASKAAAGVEVPEATSAAHG